MLLDIIPHDLIPAGLELWLADITGYFTPDEREVYASLKSLKKTLKNGADLEKLQIYRNQEIRRVYCVYSGSERNRFKPDFHRRIHQLINQYDKRIKNLESISE